MVVICLTSFKAFLKKAGETTSGYENQRYARGTEGRNVKNGGMRGSILLKDPSSKTGFDTYKEKSIGIDGRDGSTSNNSEEILVR